MEESVIGSLKELTVRMSVTSQSKPKTIKNNINSHVSDFDSDFDMIDMPLDSHIARPSNDKKSTIRKTHSFPKKSQSN